MLVRCAVFTALELEIACGQKKFLQSLFDLAGEAAVGVMFYCNFTCFCWSICGVLMMKCILYNYYVAKPL